MNPKSERERQLLLNANNNLKSEKSRSATRRNLDAIKCTKRCWSACTQTCLCLSIMYILLFTFLTGLLIIVLQLIVSEDKPYLTGEQSLLKLLPGLSYRPSINFRTSLIMYQSTNPQSYMPYVQNIRTFMNLYEEVNIRPQDAFASCEESIKTPDDPQMVCKFFPMVLGPCVKENNFGYDRSEPCVILKINKVYGWIPDIVNVTMSKNPLIQCHGRNKIDNESFGRLRYFPNVTINGQVYGYFSNLYFPYLIQFAYRSPLVAIQFSRVLRHSMFMITCSIINLSPAVAPVSFEILID